MTLFSVETRNLTKKFGTFKAVDNLNLKVRKGEIYGLVGPNGAGKTTTLKMILGLMHPTEGEVYINGSLMHPDNVDIKKELAYLPERVSFYRNLTPVQTLNFFCELKGADKSIIAHILKELGLGEVSNRKVGTFSKGMVQILGFAQTMIGSPSFYILDEPSSGLDARWVRAIREKIRYLNKRGATIMFSSHILSEVQALCDRVGVINKGHLIAEDSIENLNRKLNIMPKLIIKVRETKNILQKDIENIDGVHDAEIKDRKIIISCSGDRKLQIIEDLKNMGISIEDFSTIEPSVEDAFVRLVGGGK